MTRRQVFSRSLFSFILPSLFYPKIWAKSKIRSGLKSVCGTFDNEEPLVENFILPDEERLEHEGFLRKAIDLAKAAKGHCNHPFGAILVHENKIILKAENRVYTDGDSTQHAEFRLISEANRAQHITSKILKQSTLYTSAEPCAMCCGAIFWSGVRQVVYSAPHDSFGSGSFRLPSRQVFKYARRSEVGHKDKSIIVIGPLLSSESIPLVKDYFENDVGSEAKKCSIKFEV